MKKGPRQPRNAEATRERILEAAMSEFSSYGVAGARVDRIAVSAGCNKNLIYVYFDSKEGLFAALLKKHLARVYEELEFTPEDLPGYAGRLFDFAMSHPELMRLMAWFGLEKSIESPSERRDAIAGKLASIEEAQRQGRVRDDIPARTLMTLIMNIATGWSAANPFGQSAASADGDRATMRQQVERAVALLTSPST